jgi:predicted nucleic acid-binding protein
VADRLVVADASPLIGLAAAGAFDLLQRLFGQMSVTRSVHDEVMAGAPRPGASELARALQEDWIRVVEDPGGATAFPELGAGEASTLAIALTHPGPRLVLMDDPVGRARARSLDLEVSGVLGVVLAAKRAGLVEAVRPYLDRLADSGFRLADDVVEGVLAVAGED